MAEVFNNYLTRKTYSSDVGSITIIPAYSGSIDSSIGTGSRTKDSKAQVHSIYLTQEVESNETANPLTGAVFVSLSIYDNAAQTEVYIANNVMILPHSSFYIEKTITLLSQQELRLTYGNATLNPNTKTISTVCSTIEIVD